MPDDVKLPLAHRVAGFQDLCRMDEAWLRAIRQPGAGATAHVVPLLTILLGSAAFGAAFGVWRSPVQSAYSAAKMPVMILSVVVISAAINAMLAPLLGAALSFRQTLACMLTGFSLTCALLGAFSPIVAFFGLAAPSCQAPGAWKTYQLLLIANTGLVGLCGGVGMMRLYALLRQLAGDGPQTRRVLLAWFLVSGLVGCQLSWMLSPFLAKPGTPVPWINPDAFNGNVFEYLWRIAHESI